MLSTFGESYLNLAFGLGALLFDPTSTMTVLSAPTPSGVSQRTESEETHTTLGQPTPPTDTRGCSSLSAAPKFLPPIVMMVPPFVGPFDGLSLLTTGAGALSSAAAAPPPVESMLIDKASTKRPLIATLCPIFRPPNHLSGSKVAERYPLPPVP